MILKLFAYGGEQSGLRGAAWCSWMLEHMIKDGELQTCDGTADSASQETLFPAQRQVAD